MGKNKKIIQLTHNQLTTFISEIVLDVSSQRQLDEQFDFSWEGFKNIPSWWEDKIDETFDFSWEGVNNIDDWWTGKDYIDVGDYIEDIVDDASDALSDFADNATEVAEEFADYLVDTYETVADWTAELVEDVADMGSSVINWIKKQADSVIWYWTKGPGGRFLRGCGRLFSELAQFVVRPTTAWGKLKLKINIALATGDTDYLESLSDAIICGAGILLTALTALSVGLLGGVATATLYAIALVGFFKYFATNATKVRIGFPQEGWEYVVQKAAQTLGVFSGVFRSLDENARWWSDYPSSAGKVKTLFIGSHGKAGHIITLPTKLGGNGSVELFDDRFLAPIKPHLDANTKVFFTACHGANNLAALKLASEYLGCECYGCEGMGWGGKGCEHNAWRCDPGTPLHKDMEKAPLPTNFMRKLLSNKVITTKCSIENPDNIQSIQTFLANKGIDISYTIRGVKKTGIDGGVGNRTAKGIAEYLGYPSDVNSVKTLKSYLKNDLGYRTILTGNNPGTWGPNTNNLISLLLATHCSMSTKVKAADDAETVTTQVGEYASNDTVEKSGGCLVVNKDNWWMDYLA